MPGVKKVGRIRMKDEMLEIATLVGEYFDVSVSEMKGRSNDPDIVFARHVAMYYCYRELFPGATHKSIAAFFGGRDHSGSLYASNRIRRVLSEKAKPTLIKNMEKSLQLPDFSAKVAEFKTKKQHQAAISSKARREERERKGEALRKDHKRWLELSFGKPSDSNLTK